VSSTKAGACGASGGQRRTKGVQRRTSDLSSCRLLFSDGSEVAHARLLLRERSELAQNAKVSKLVQRKRREMETHTTHTEGEVRQHMVEITMQPSQGGEHREVPLQLAATSKFVVAGNSKVGAVPCGRDRITAATCPWKALRDRASQPCPTADFDMST